VVVSVEATRDFAEVAFLREVDPGAAAGVRAAFDAALAAANQVGETIPEAVVKPQGRVRVESLQQAVGRVEERLALEIGGVFGVTTGFNSMDGD
jgi:predicted lipoprotein